MRIGSGVQSVSELFGKRQNNSKTSVNGNEAFPQTSMKVYLKTDDMLFSGGNGTGLSFYIKYAEESTDDNPVVIAKGIDENGKEFEEKININDIDLRNASYVEMSALEAYYDVDRGNSLSSFPQETGHMGLNERCDLISSFEKVIQDMNKLGKYDFADVLYAKYEYLSKSGKTEKSIKLFIDSCWNENLYDVNLSGTDYLQGTITLVGNDGTSAPVQIANYSGDSWTLTFTGVKVGVRYHFHYELYSVGSSQVGYIASAAYAQ